MTADGSAALRPRDEADLAQILAGGQGPFELIGGGSKRGIGRPVAAARLDLSALCGVVDYQPHELVLTALAATPVRHIEALLAQHRQRLAFEPPQLGRLLGAPDTAATLGGVLAANISGPRRLSAGAARDHFLGFRAVGSAGERFRGGGRVVKNVTGFDLPKLLAGSWGTLAVMTELTLRVTPTAETELTVLLPPASLEAAIGVFTRALSCSYEVSAAALLPGEGVGLRLEGFGPSVQSRTLGLLARLGGPDHRVLEEEASHRFWHGIGEVHHLARFPIVWRLSLPPQAAARVIRRIDPPDFLLDWGGGLAWLGMHEPDAVRVRAALAGNGHATLIKAPEALRRAGGVFSPQPAPIAALDARLKAAFDPTGRLNPGRMD